MPGGQLAPGTRILNGTRKTMLDTAAPPTTTAALRELIASVRSIVQTRGNPQEVGTAVANILPQYLGSDELLAPEQMEPSADCYRQHVLHVEPNGSFSVVSLVWLPGQATAIHDHVSWCVVGVHKGEEHETIYKRAGGEADAHLVVTGRTVNRCGSVAALVPPGDIHHVANGGDCLAVSLHIYGADIGQLGSSIRRHYHFDVRPSAAAAVVH